jgi:16S rRNA (guanine527-N7)-methyltransferase
LGASALERLDIYRRWLGSEAIPAGAVGPGERDRLHDRHLGDSILFGAGLDPSPEHVLDIGSGAGLPGIPLAILMEQTRFTLLDRSVRRAELMRRAVRILELENVSVVQGEIEQRPDQEMAVVSRGTFPPARAQTVIGPRLGPGGVAVLGGSWVDRPQHRGWATIEIPATVLDHTVWLLIMRHT